MKRFVFLIVVCFISVSAAPGMGSSLPDTKTVSHALSVLSVPFIENKGQIDEDVAYYAKTFGSTLFVTTKGELAYGFPDFTLIERITGLAPVPRGLAPSRTNVSFFIGNDPSKWQKSLSTYGSVSIGEIAPGITVSLNAYGGRIEKIITISPQTDPSIAITVDGASSLGLAHTGELIIYTEKGDLSFSKPIAYQEINGKRIPVPVAYMLPRSSLSYTFALGPYDPFYAVTIDPILQSTYLGGSGTDIVPALVLGTEGVYVAGYTSSSNFPGTSGSAQPVLGGGTDAFVALLSSDLRTLTQSTYLGGNGNDCSWALALSTEGVYVAGYTSSSNFPGTSGSAQPVLGGGTDAFVALLSSDLRTLTQSTYLGGNGEDTSLALALDAQRVYLAGRTSSSVFPGVSGGVQAAFGGGDYDAFVALLSSDLRTLTQSTYLGGNGLDQPSNIALDAEGVYVAGCTESSDFPSTAGSAQPVLGGSSDAFVALLSSDLTTLTQSTYLGGSGDDYALAFVLGTEGVYVVGETSSSNFPGASGSAQPVLGGSSDAFVALLSSDLTTLTQSTYLGGNSRDRALAFTQGTEEVYVAGLTSSSDFPGTSGGVQAAFGGGDYDAFVALLSSDLRTLTQSTYLGGNANDHTLALALGTEGIYVSGLTSSSDFPGTSGGVQAAFGGGDYDAFVALLSSDLRWDHRLTITKSGTGSGSVTSDPLGIDCGSTCSALFIQSTTITLTAIAGTGSTLSSWSGCDSVSNNLCIVFMTGDKLVSAMFVLNPHTLIATKQGSGTGTLTAQGLSCNGDTCSGIYSYNEAVQITATASGESIFAGWSGCDSVNGNVCNVLINGDKNVTATFYLEYTLLVDITGTGEGRVVSTPTGIDCEPTCSDTFLVGTPITLTAYPYGGSAFAYWSGACSGAATTCEITMSCYNEVFAHFVSDETKEYKLSVGKKRINKGDGLVQSDDGTISCGDICSGLYYPNAPIILRATPSLGSLFEGWTPTSLNCGTSPTCSFTMDAKHSVKAIFRGPYRLMTKIKSKNEGSGSVTADISGIGTGINCPSSSCEDYYSYGNNVVLTAQSGGGSQFMGWKPTSLGCGTNLTCTIPMTKKQSVTATFEGL